MMHKCHVLCGLGERTTQHQDAIQKLFNLADNIYKAHSRYIAVIKVTFNVWCINVILCADS